MWVLAFDTATAATVVGLSGDGGLTVSEARDDPSPGQRPRHTQSLLELAQSLLDDAGIGWADLDRVGVGVGPGSFTGLRVGVATARALTSAHEIPLVAISSLRALAAGAAAGARPVIALIDARRGEAFAAVYDGEAEVHRPAALPPGALARLGVAGSLAVGDGALRFRDVLQGAGAEVPPPEDPVHRIGADALVKLAVQAKAVPPTDVVPRYLRHPDAQPRQVGATDTDHGHHRA